MFNPYAKSCIRSKPDSFMYDESIKKLKYERTTGPPKGTTVEEGCPRYTNLFEILILNHHIMISDSLIYFVRNSLVHLAFDVLIFYYCHDL